MAVDKEQRVVRSIVGSYDKLVDEEGVLHVDEAIE